MPTKLSRYADGLMEAAWLAAIVMTPLFFNKYSSRIFEPDKATLMRSLALITLAAWLVKIVDVGLSKRNRSEKVDVKTILKIPLILPVTAFAMTYIIATIFSVTPRISFWGSYQRLQGTYTAFSYLVFFAAIVANLRKRTQVDRLITTAILTSLPISLYGVLQHYGIDPIPWGGDVTRRVASSMGNAIFVAAYLILVFPLTIGKIVEAFSAILNEEDNIGKNVARATVYIFIAALQFIIISPPFFFSNSRGPFLGFAAGSFFLFLLLSLYWRKRWMTITTIAIAGIIGGFLLLINIPNGPLQSLENASWIGRLNRLLETESKTGKVRVLIWEGSAEMVAPHDPLEYPDGKTDWLNAIRPAIGYGPETMHMAYNPFYPPELAHVEKRNASPDRSHNETWDSLVITGGIGLIVYLGLFITLFYYGFKWLRLIKTPGQRYLFFSLFMGGGVIGAVSFIIWQGIGLFGIGLPFGMIIGLIGYLTINALFFKGQTAGDTIDPVRDITLIVLLSAILAHFVETNFGIAIVSTRTHFWIYAALLLVVGYIFPKTGEYQQSGQTTTVSKAKITKKTRRRSKSKTRRSGSGQPTWLRGAVIGGTITAIILLPLNFEFIANLQGKTSTRDILWSSLTQVNNNATSYGVLALILTAWLAASVVLASESNKTQEIKDWFLSLATILGISGALSGFYGIWLSGTLANLAKFVPTTTSEVMQQAASFEGLLSQFYGFLFLILFVLAGFLPEEWPKRGTGVSIAGPVLAPIALILALVLGASTNIQVIQADIAFKMAEPFSRSKQWPVAILLYQRAKELAPDEDYYYLFLGRGYLEQSKELDDPVEKEQIFQEAESDLKLAQKVNPLNPDHTANLGRLYSWWAMQTSDQVERLARGEISQSYYERVTVLSPNNARLWDEWATLYFSVLDEPDLAYDRLAHSLEIDSQYDWTHALMGDYYAQSARRTEDEDEHASSYKQAIYHYGQAIEWSDPATLNGSQGLNYFYALASAYQAIDDFEMMAEILERSLEYATSKNDIWKIEENLARVYIQLNDNAQALDHAQNALIVAPETEQERLRTLISQLQGAP